MAYEFQFNLDNLNNNTPELNPETLYDLLIVGGGPAGLNAALYAKRKGLETGIVTKQIGGQVVNTSSVENYLGTESTSGEELVNNFKSHVQNLEVPVAEYVEVEKILPNQGDNYHSIQLTDGTIYNSRTLLLATGTNHRKLGVEGEERLAGRGVAYCAICDAPLYKNKKVIIAGGGNSAVEAALDLAKVASHVTLVHRSEFRADKILVDELYKNDKIDIHLQSQILSIEGQDFLSHIHVLDKLKDTTFDVSADGIFIEIGNVPNSQLFQDIIDLNDIGEVIVDHNGLTSVEGIYAAGDVTTVNYKQIIIATSDGAKTALAANDYINITKAKERTRNYENVK
jgi:alkyl hydroperoxide reductase subunit F